MKQYELEYVHNNLSNYIVYENLKDVLYDLERNIQNDVFYYYLNKKNTYYINELYPTENGDDNVNTLLEVSIKDYATNDTYKNNIKNKISKLKGVL